MASRSRSFVFNNVTKQITIAGQVLTDGSSSTPVVSGNLSSNTQSNITAVGTLASLTVSGNISAANYNYANGVSILAGVIANAGAQSGQIVSANLAMKGYVDDQISTTASAISTANTAMVGYVGQQVTTANTAMVGYVGQQVTTANTAMVGYVGQQVTTANTALKGYVDGQITNLVNGAPSTLDTINELAAALGNDANLSVTLTSYISNVNANIGTANLALKGYIDNQITVLTSNTAITSEIANLWSNAAVQAGSIADLLANAGAQSASIATLTSNAAVQSGDIATIYANLGAVSGSLATLTSNAAVQAGAIATLTANAASQSGDIATLFANAGAQSGAIVAANTAMKGYVDGQILTVGIGGSNYSNSNVAAYLPTYTGAIAGSSFTATGDISGAYLKSTNSSGDEGGEIQLTKAATNTTLTTGVTIDIYQNKVRIFETGGTNRGGYFDIAAMATSVGTNLATGGGGGSTYGDSNVAAYLTTNQYAVIGNITTANTALKGYVDGQITTLTSNAAVQAGDIATIYANLGAVSGSITTLTSNAAVQAGQITSANLAMKGYVDGQISGLINSAPGTLDTLNEIAIALGNDANLSATLTSMILDVQTEVSTANTAMRGYVDLSVSSIPPNKISDSNSNVTVSADYVNVAVDSSNVGSFSSTGFTTTGDIISGGKLVVNDATDFTNPAVNAVQIEGGINVMKTAFFGGNAIINVTTPSTSTSTGALTVTGGVGVGGNVHAANLTATNGIYGTVRTAAQTTITSVGTLSALTVNGATVLGNSSGVRLRSVESGGVIYIQAGNGVSNSANTITFAPWTQTASTMSIDIANRRVGVKKAAPTVELDVDGTGAFSGNVSAGNLSATNLTGTIRTAAQPSITSVGTLTGLTVGGYTQIAYSTSQYVGMSVRSNYGNATAQSISFIDFPNENGVATGHFFNVHETDGSTTTIIGGTPAGVRNSDRRVELLRVTGAGTLTVGQRNATVAIANGGSNGVGNIGASGAGFNTVFARATSAQYADLAEIYTSDKKYIPGTVVVFGGDKEVTVSTISHDPSVAGVVSTNPAYLMNDTVEGAAVALQGRVPCRVLGPVSKGDRVVTSDVRGVAERLDMTKYQPGCIIGKALGSVPDGEIATIEVVVGRN